MGLFYDEGDLEISPMSPVQTEGGAEYEYVVVSDKLNLGPHTIRAVQDDARVLFASAYSTGGNALFFKIKTLSEEPPPDPQVIVSILDVIRKNSPLKVPPPPPKKKKRRR